MFLRFRPATMADLPECFDCIQNRFAFAAEGQREALLGLWQELLSQGSQVAAVMEDLTAPSGQRIVWFCSKVFPNAEYAASLARGEASPIPARYLLDLWQQKRPLPLLSREDLQRANTDPASGEGISMLVWHYGSPDHVLSSDRWLRVAEKLISFTEYFSAGYRLKEIFEEFYSEEFCCLAGNAGFTLRSDYADWHQATDTPLPPEGQRARLMGADAAEAAKLPGTLVSAVFQYETPRFFFRFGEQDLLLYALLGDTDEELAARLGLAAVTIKKRWQGIYERVQAVLPEIFTATDLSTDGGNGVDNPPSDAAQRSRGPEKRRRLLAYLRHHIEELRPVIPRHV